jgi:mannosyltransferase
MVATDVKIPLRPVPAEHRAPVVALLVPAATMAVLGIWGLGRRGLSGEEAVTWSAARRSTAQLWSLLADFDTAQGPYHLLMHGILLLRADEVTLRLPSVAAMSCAAAGVAALGSRIAGPRVGTVAGTLFAIVPEVSRYAQQGSPDALVTACAVASTYALVRGEQGGRPCWWRRYALFTGIAVLLDPFALLLPAAHAATLLLSRSEVRVWLRWGLSTAVGAAVATPTAWAVLGHGGAADGPLAAPGWGAVTRLVRSFAGPSGWVACMVLLLAASVLFAPRRAVVRAQAPGVPRLTAVTVGLPLLVVPPALLIAVSQWHPVYDQRQVLYALPGLSLLAASGIDRLTGSVLWRGSAPVAAALGVSLVLGGQFGAHRDIRSPASRPDDLRPIARLVGREAKPGDGVLFLTGARRRTAVAYPGEFAGLRDVALAGAPGPSGTLFGTELPPDRLRKALSGTQHVWVLDGEDRDPARRRAFRDPGERVKQEVLAEEFHREGVERLHGGSVHLYVHD